VFDEQIESNPAAVAVSTTPLFALPIGEHVHEWTVWLSKEDVWKRYSTLSQIAILEGEEREVSFFSFFVKNNNDNKRRTWCCGFCDFGTVWNVLLIVFCALSQRAYKVYTDAVNAADVETNDKGQLALHGMTVSIWTTKIPSEGAGSLLSDVVEAVKDKLS